MLNAARFESKFFTGNDVICHLSGNERSEPERKLDLGMKLSPIFFLH